MELILEFIISPILSAIRATFEFVFWMICWAVWQVMCGVADVGSSLRTWLLRER